MQAELLGQAKQVTGVKQEQKSGDGEGSSMQAPKVGLLPKLRPCLVCISRESTGVNPTPDSSSCCGWGLYGILPLPLPWVDLSMSSVPSSAGCCPEQCANHQ